MNNSKFTGHLSLFVANLIFGLNNPIASMLMPEVIHPMALTFLRFSGGLVLFWLASFFMKSEKVSSKDKFLLAVASFFALVLNQIPFFYGLSLTSPIDASIVVTMLPIATMLLSAIILREPITQLKVIGVLVGASGALLVVFSSHQVEGGQGNMLGNLIVFLAVISFGLYLTLFKNLISRYHPVTVMKWMFLFATVFGLPFCYKAVAATDVTLFSSTDWLSIGFVVVFATFFGYLLIPIGQKTLRPTTLSMYNYMQPVVASLVAIVWGIDKFGYQQALAGLLVFAGVYIVTQSKSRAQLEAERHISQIQ
ncbi:MAG: DMT family transporter [Paludibacter sp.]|nr:DMT family transporter [Paludibacter sp.]